MLSQVAFPKELQNEIDLLKAENEKLKFRLSNVTLSVPIDFVKWYSGKEEWKITFCNYAFG